jgi:hypothetical protein
MAATGYGAGISIVEPLVHCVIPKENWSCACGTLGAGAGLVKDLIEREDGSGSNLRRFY